MSDTQQDADKAVQWVANGSGFSACGKTFDSLAPGFYLVGEDEFGRIIFTPKAMKDERLIPLHSGASASILKELSGFWSQAPQYHKFGLAFRRGILMYGPPGSGKTCTMRAVIQRLIKQGGIAFHLVDPRQYRTAISTFRSLHPTRPVVVVMEEVDELCHRFGDAYLCNVLDGIEGDSHVIFLATTNYPEKLPQRLVNRPSRFDKRFYIGLPDALDRATYLENIRQDVPIDVAKWATDTQGFSFAHLKELFINHVVIGTPYEEALATVRKMDGVISSEDPDPERKRSDLTKALADYTDSMEGPVLD